MSDAQKRSPGDTVPRQFRLSTETIAHLDLIVGRLKAQLGVPFSRADAIRYAARIVATGDKGEFFPAKRGRKKSDKKS